MSINPWMKKAKYAIFKFPIEWLSNQDEFLAAIGNLGGPFQDIDFSLMEDPLNLSEPGWIKVRFGATMGIVTSMKSSGKVQVGEVSWDVTWVEDVEKPE